MNRIFLSITLCLLPIMLFAQPRSVNRTTSAMPEESEAQQIMRKAKTGKPYDVTRNFLGVDNLYSYVGQELYVIPREVIKAGFFGTNEGYYGGFLPPEVDEYYSGDMLYYNAYKCGLGTPETPAKYLARRTFVVDRIRQVIDSPHEFIFFMHDKKTGEHVNYLYNIKGVDRDDDVYFWNFPDFPFLTLSHFNYMLKKYQGKPLIVAAHSFMTAGEGWHRLDAVDINTQEKLTFPEADYYQFKVEDIVLDESHAQLCFQLTDGTHSFLTPCSMSYNEPSHGGMAARKFLKSDWDKLVQKYGKSDMEAVLCTEITETMDTTLVHLTLGTGMPYTYQGGYYIMFCGRADRTVVFDENWKVKGVIMGQCSEIKQAVVGAIIMGVATYQVVNTAGRIISAPFKIVKTFVNFFGI